MSGGRGSSQSSAGIEQTAPDLERIVSASEPMRHLADGFGGPLGPAEGPLWWKEGHYLLFSDIHNDKRMKYEPGKGASVVQEPTNRANGLTRDLQGRLVPAEHDSRRVTRQELDGSTTVIANSFLHTGRRLQPADDVVVKSDGCFMSSPIRGPARLRQAMGPDFSGRLLPRHPRSRQYEPIIDHCLAQRPRLLADKRYSASTIGAPCWCLQAVRRRLRRAAADIRYCQR